MIKSLKLKLKLYQINVQLQSLSVKISSTALKMTFVPWVGSLQPSIQQNGHFRSIDFI